MFDIVSHSVLTRINPLNWMEPRSGKPVAEKGYGPDGRVSVKSPRTESGQEDLADHLLGPWRCLSVVH